MYSSRDCDLDALRPCQAAVLTRLAVPPRVAGHAVACVAVLTIRARAAMLARVAGAFVYLCDTASSFRRRLAATQHQ